METGHRENAVDFIEQMLPCKEVQEQAAGLPKDALCSVQKAAHRAEPHEPQVDRLDQPRKRQ